MCFDNLLAADFSISSRVHLFALLI